jgi:capsular exopolysaccharide synthesis family protein
MHPRTPSEPVYLAQPSAPVALPGVEVGPPLAPPALTAPPGLDTLWHTLRRRWLLIFFLGLLGAAGAFAAVWFLMPGRYSTYSLVRISTRLGAGNDTESEFIAFQKTQAVLIKSGPVIEKLLARPSVAELPEVRAHSDPVAWLQKDLVADFTLGPEILRITLNGDRPEDLAYLLNELVDVYRKTYVEEELDKLKKRQDNLEKSRDKIAERLRDARITVEEKRKTLKLDDARTLEAFQVALREQKFSLEKDRREQERLEARTKIEVAAAQALIDKPEDIPINEFDVFKELENDPAVKEQFKQLAVIEAKIQTTIRLTPPGELKAAMRTPQKEYDAINKRLEEIYGALRPAIETKLRAKELGTLRTTLAKTKIILDQIKIEKELIEKQLRGLATQVQDNVKLNWQVEKEQDKVTQAEKELTRVGEDLIAVGAEERMMPMRVMVLEHAASGQRRLDRVVKIGGAASLGVFGLIFIGITLVEYRGRRVYSSEDVSRGLNMPLVGTLPALSAKARRPVGGAVAQLPEHYALLESIDSIRTVLLHANRHEGLKVVMVTSALMGEGKTSLACHLAASLARASRKTLLIDCDLRSPSVHKQFEQEQAPGTAEVLRGEMMLEEVVRGTSHPSLSLICAGQTDLEAIQALAQERLGGLFEHLKGQYDFVVVDASPVLPVADPLLVGQHADAVLFSVMQDVSRLPAVYAAQQRLASLDIRMLGCVVIGEKPNPYGAAHYPIGTRKQ